MTCALLTLRLGDQSIEIRLCFIRVNKKGVGGQRLQGFAIRTPTGTQERSTTMDWHERISPLKKVSKLTG